MQIAQISDSHISISHPQRLDDLKATIECVNAARPDVVIHTGDIAHDALDEEYTIARDALAEIHSAVLPMVGNRDDRAKVLQTFADGEHVRTDMPFLQYSVEHLPVRLIILDTLHHSSNKGELCDARMQHLEQMLARSPQKPVAIFMHHPPFEAHEIPEPRQFEDWSQVERFDRIVSQSQTVLGIWCGHVHRNIEARAGGVAASAITCMARDLRKGQMSEAERNAPVYRILNLP